MGETVDESHVYNFVRMPNGTGLQVVDLSKGFARGMTTSEVKAMTESGQVSALAGAESGRGTIVQDAQTAAETTTMTVEEILVAMLESLCDWIDERPEARAKGWIPRRPSAGSGHPLSDIREVHEPGRNIPRNALLCCQVADFYESVTSKTGLVAAVVVLVGLAAAVQGLARPWLTDRRESRAKLPGLAISALQLSALKPYASIRELRFTISNTGGGIGLLTTLQLRVLSHGPSEEPRETVVAAPIDVYEHRVELNVSEDIYDIRGRAFGSAAPPLKYAEGAVDAFVVTLVA